MIPKIIHYCWLSKEPIPKVFQKYIDGWKKILKDYEFILWDTNKIDMELCLWVKQAFANKKYAFASDYIRLYAIYNYGGIYLDSDVEVLRKFDSYLHLKSMIGYQRDGGGLEVAAFGAERHSPWVKVCLNELHNLPFIKADGKFDLTVLPHRIKAILEGSYSIRSVNTIEEAETAQKNNLIPIFSSEYFSPKSFLTSKIYLNKNTVCIHHFAGSWIPNYERLWQTIRKKLKVRKRILRIIEMLHSSSRIQ